MSESSARRKLKRGIEQVNALRDEAATFEDAEVYEFTTECERRSPKQLACRSFATRGKPQPDHWPLLAGEAIQNLRSALDHSVYELVPASKRGKSIFPIYKDPCEFQVLGRRDIPGIPEAIRTLIEQAQPYRRRLENPDRDPLQELRSLSNIDKHRTLTTFDVAVIPGPIFGVGWAKVTNLVTHRALTDDKTEIASFIVQVADGVEIDQVQVTPIFSYEVRIQARPLFVLTAIARRVFEIVVECETGQAFSPDTTYPELFTKPNEIYGPWPPGRPS